ncbi:MAG: hypothetical protein ACNYNX_02080 [Leucobacter sp.]
MQIIAKLTPVAVEGAEDLKSLSVRIESGSSHLWIRPEDIVALVGELGSDPQWSEQFAGMIAYAASKGWTDESGAVRAHIEQES